jgi:hypothetical protein
MTMPTTEDMGEIEEIRRLSSQTDTFLFWNDEREDLYQDFITSK